MSKFYLPSSSAASTTSPSPLHSPTSESTPTRTSNFQALHGLPSTKSPSQEPYYFSDTPTASDSDNDDLPYPTPLPRSAFLAPDFSPQVYLSTLRNRHQTLEDLRTELRERVRDLSKELVDLVNNEYEDLMSVGMMLKGGEEKTEGVRVGVLGFQREIEGLRGLVRERKVEVGEAIRERREVREGVVLGRRLLEVEDRVGELERRLGVAKTAQDGEGVISNGIEEEEDDSDDDDEEDEEDDGTFRVRSNARLYGQLRDLMGTMGQHPFLEKQVERIKAIREALLLDLGAALRLARKAEDEQTGTLRVISVYREIGEAAEAVKILKVK